MAPPTAECIKSASESRPGFYLMKSAIENLIGLPGAACKVQSAGPLQFTCNTRTMHTEQMVTRLRAPFGEPSSS